jgi:hypothetical protein
MYCRFNEIKRHTWIIIMALVASLFCREGSLSETDGPLATRRAGIDGQCVDCLNNPPLQPGVAAVF